MRIAMKRLARPLAAALAFALCAGSAQAQRCAEGVPRTATLGIGLLQCVGGSCTLNARDGSGRAHDFSTEPKVWRLEADGPSAGVLRDGDQILAVDGALITTRDGGRRLANLRADDSSAVELFRTAAHTREAPAPTGDTLALVGGMF